MDKQQHTAHCPKCNGTDIRISTHTYLWCKPEFLYDNGPDYPTLISGEMIAQDFPSREDVRAWCNTCDDEDIQIEDIVFVTKED